MKKPDWKTDPRVIRQPTLAQIKALKQVFEGKADELEQKHFMAWLIKDVCGFDDHTAFLGPNAMESTWLMIGRQRVAQILRGYIETPLDRFRDQPGED